jgi:hypothetical protein
MSPTELADPTLLPALLEAAMMLCFGIAWPVASLRMLRSRRPEGKGLVFTAIILSGYIAGALAKLASAAHGHELPPVFWLYLLNTVSVCANLLLQWALRRRNADPVVELAVLSAR